MDKYDSDTTFVVALFSGIAAVSIIVGTIALADYSLKTNCMKEMNIATPSRSVDEIKRLCRG